MPRIKIGAAVVAMMVAAGTLLPAAGLPGESQRLSVSSAGAQANGDTPATTVPDVTSPAMSLDGRWVAFSSDASNLVANDRNGVADVFLRDMRRGTTRLISTAQDRTQGNGASYSPAMSVDGMWIAFVSTATNLVPGDTNQVADVFLVHRKKRRVERISVASNGAQADGPSNRPFVSLFGRWVTFESAATNLVPRDVNSMPDAFKHDRTTRRTTMFRPPAVDGEDAEELVMWTENPSISYDGRYTSFVRKARRKREEVPISRPAEPPTVEQEVPLAGIHLTVGPPDDLLASDVFVRDERRRRNRAIEVTKWAGRYTNFSDNAQISADGRRVVFDVASVVDANALAHSNGDVPPELVFPDDPIAPNPVDHRDVYMYDRVARVVFPVSKNMWGPQANGSSYAPQVSSEGHAVAFISEATNLVPGDDNGLPDVFVWDSRDRSVTMASVARDGGAPAGGTTAFSMSYEGRHIAFASTANDIVAADGNGRSDVFHRDRRIDTPNQPPRMKKVLRVYPTITLGQQATFRLRAKDPDGDSVRYGIVGVAPPPNSPTAHPAGGIPAGMTIDPVTGDVSWTPQANQVGPWVIAFWAGDPRGTSVISAWPVVVRSPVDELACDMRGDCR